MKKAVFLIIFILLAGCGGNDSGSTSESSPSAGDGVPANQTPQPSPPDVPAGPQGFPFEAYGQVVYVCASAAPILEAFPEPQDVFESPSCAFDGVDITYFYPGFELTTYPYNGEEHILSVMFIDDSITTPEGVYLGGTLENIERAYGGGYEQNGAQYRYTKGRGSLIFTLEDGFIIGIFYTMVF
jgi:hypothetical protein